MSAPTLNGGAKKGFDSANTTATTVLLPSWTDGDTVYIAIVSDLPNQTIGLPLDNSSSSTGWEATYSDVAIYSASHQATFALFRLPNAQHARFAFNGTDYTCAVPVTTTERQVWQSWSVSNDGGIDAQGTNADGSSATATIPSVTTDVNDCLIFGIVATDAVSTPHGAATGYTKLDEVSGTSAGSLSVYSTTLSSLGTQASATVSITSEQWLGVSFALKPAGVSGTATITLGAATVSAAGTVAITGTASITLDAVTVTGDGDVPRTGSAAITLDAATVSATGTGTASGTGTANITLADLTVSAAGNVPIVGTAVITLNDATLSADGDVPRTGTAALQLDALTLSATGTLPAALTPPSIRDGTRTGYDTGNTSTTTVTLAPSAFSDGDTVWIAIVSDAGSQIFTAPPRFEAIYNNVGTGSNTATLAVFRQKNILKANESFDGTDYTFSVGVATPERQSWICWATTGDGNIDVQGTNVTGSSTTVSIPTLTTTIDAALVFGIVATDGATTPHNGSATYTKLAEASGTSAGSISVWHLTKETAGVVAADSFTIPSEQWVGVSFALAPIVGGQAAITLGALTVSASGTMALRGSADITLGALTTTSSGTVPRTGTAAITLGDLTVISYPPRTGTATVTLDALTLTGNGGGLTPLNGTAAITLGSLTTDATGTVPVDLPAPTIRATSTGYDTGNTNNTTIILPDFLDGDTLYIALVSDASSQIFTTPAPLLAPSKPFATLHSNIGIPTTSRTATFALFYQQNAQRADFAFDGANYTVTVPVVFPERQSYIAFAVTSDGGTDEQGANETGNSATAIIPAITPRKNNSLLIGIIATDGSSTPHTGATNYTKQTEVDGPSAGSLSLWTHVLPIASTYAADSVTITSEQWLGVSFSIPPTLPGRVNATLGELTLSATGVIPVVGSATITLGEIQTTSSGTVPRTGSAAITLDPLTISSTPPRSGTAAITLGELTTSATGIVLSGHVGNAEIPLGALTLNGNGSTANFVLPKDTVGIPATIPPPLLGTLFTIDIENAAGVKLGGGPIITGIRWTYKQKLSAAGEWSLEVPLAEPRTQYATLKRRVHCYVRRSGRLVWLGGGIIESRSYGLSGDNTPVLTLSGPDLLRELAGVTLKAEIGTSIAIGRTGTIVTVPTATGILNAILETVPTWTSVVPAISSQMTVRFVHESVLNALIATCEKAGAFFWMEPYVTRPRSIIVATAPVVSSIVATNLADGLAAERNANLCLISNIEKTETSWDAHNRLIVYGAGDGQARLTLAAATQWPNGSSVLYDYTYADPYDRNHVFRLDKTTNTITDILAVADYGTIEQAAAFKEIAPITPNDADMIAAANTLVVAAVNQLVLSSFPTQSYRLTVAALRAVVHPGMQIRVQARKYRDGIPVINIDERLIIQEVDYEIDATGEKVTGLTVATTWKAEKTGATILSEQIQKITALEAHPQIGANENTISYREDVDDDYGAAFPFWLSRGTQQINSVTLRYKLEQLRSSVKSVGGTATGSVDIPDHSHTLTDHHHEIPNHQHVFDVDPGTNSSPVYVYSGGGTSGGLMAGGISSQINVHTNSSSGAVTSDDNSSIAVGGGGTGGVTVDISNAITAAYGVFVDSGVAYGVDDLAWTANGASIVGVPTMLGSGWYEVDITSYLTDLTTLRPLAYSNTIEVAVKPTNKAAKKVRVTAQIELRTTIQTLAVV